MNKVMEYMALLKRIVRFDMTEGHDPAQATSLCPRPNDAASLAAAILELLPTIRRAAHGRPRPRADRAALASTCEVPKPLAACEAMAAARWCRPSSPLVVRRSDVG